MSTALQTEFSTYMRRLPALLEQHDGEYVVIKGPEVVHFAPGYEEALTWGYEQYGLEDFFVKRVAADAGAVHLLRGFVACQPQS